MPSASATSSTPRATAPAPWPRLSSERASSERTELVTSWVSGSWNRAPATAPSCGGPVLAGVHAGERHRAGEAPAVKVRDQAAGGAQQRRLAVTGQSREQAQLARLDLEADVVERRLLDVRVAVGDVVEGRGSGSWVDPSAVAERQQDGGDQRAQSAPVAGVTGM